MGRPHLYCVVHRDELWHRLGVLAVNNHEVVKCTERPFGRSHRTSVPVQEQSFWPHNLRSRYEHGEPFDQFELSHTTLLLRT